MTINISSRADVKLTGAILLYSDKPDSIRYSTIHPVESTMSGPTIKPGAALTKAALLKTMKSLLKESPVNFEFLPERVISLSAHHIMWWRPAIDTRVFFNNKQIGKKNAVVPHPPLLFVVAFGRWYVFALPSNTRPAPETELKVSPYFNVWDHGHICAGSAKVPDGLCIDTLDRWEAAFFESQFTHPNGSKRITSHPTSDFALWNELLAGKHTHFPSNFLINAGSTVQAILAGLQHYIS